MLDNVQAIQELGAEARRRARAELHRTVRRGHELGYLDEGWRVQRQSKNSVRLEKAKSHSAWHEDRVWYLLYRLGFAYLSGVGGSQLHIGGQAQRSPTSQVDAVALDDEVGLVVECKSSERLSRRQDFQEDLGKLTLKRQKFSEALRKDYPSSQKRQIGLILWLNNISFSSSDEERAREAGVVVFGPEELEYYHSLATHLGESARYQFLADVFPGKAITGLNVRIPAVRTKVGKTVSYTFSIAPSYLLKIAYVSHRAKGTASDVDTYQRMINKSRLNRIREYILEDGFFPTNIVVNLNKRPVFDLVDSSSSDSSGQLGWLELRPAYKSAWIIDGQHRLFAYSGLDRASTARVAVIAYDGLSPSTQAELFIDINGQQKSVKQSLLQELFAELHWNSDDPKDKVKAIVSKSIQSMDSDVGSPLFGRVLTADAKRTFRRCITLNILFKELVQEDLYITKTRKGGPSDFGPLWGGDDPHASRIRTVTVLNYWFDTIRDSIEDWWDLGSNDGGGIAMNDGIASLIQLLRSLFHYLENRGQRLSRLSDADLLSAMQPYAQGVASHLSSLSHEERRLFREGRGVQGVVNRRRKMEAALHFLYNDFLPDGLQDWINLQAHQTNANAHEVINEMELLLQRLTIDILKNEYGDDTDDWWSLGVPVSVRKPAALKYEDDGGKRGGREFYLELIDYRTIAQNKWGLFSSTFGYTEAGPGKDRQTKWIVELNDNRRLVAHPSSGQMVSIDQLDLLRRYLLWLRNQATLVQDESIA